VGRHRGHHHYTVGQRRGLGVAATEPLYVLGTDADANRVTVGPRAALATRQVAVRGARLHRAGAEVDAVKLRYRSKPLACRVEGDVAPGTHRQLRLALADPVDGAAPGQTACLLRGDVVVGYGTIARSTA
jgi:tRNA-uridine 2-sulfurtransferase